MTRVLLFAALLVVAGCSRREEVPKITREEFQEVQENLPWGKKAGNAD